MTLPLVIVKSGEWRRREVSVRSKFTCNSNFWFSKAFIPDWFTMFTYGTHLSRRGRGGKWFSPHIDYVWRNLLYASSAFHLGLFLLIKSWDPLLPGACRGQGRKTCLEWVYLLCTIDFKSRTPHPPPTWAWVGSQVNIANPVRNWMYSNNIFDWNILVYRFWVRQTSPPLPLLTERGQNLRKKCFDCFTFQVVRILMFNYYHWTVFYITFKYF